MGKRKNVQRRQPVYVALISESIGETTFFFVQSVSLIIVVYLTVLFSLLVWLCDWFQSLKKLLCASDTGCCKIGCITFLNTFRMLMIVFLLITSSSPGLRADSILELIPAVKHRLNSGSVYLLHDQEPGEYWASVPDFRSI
jgi:H+/Cl- antiporter ClcA